MRWGLRLQLLGLLAVAMALGFLPLWFASTTVARVAFERIEARAAVDLGHSVGGKLALDRGRLPSRELLAELETQVTSGAVAAVAVYAPNGRVLARVGDPVLVPLLAERPEAGTRRMTSGRLVALSFVPDRFGGVATARFVGSGSQEARALSRIVSFYIAAAALTVLVLTYFAVTRWIVRPILALEQAAESVEAGARRLPPLDAAPAELLRLSHSLSRMTERLRLEEDALRAKVDEVEEKTRELLRTQASLVGSERLASVGRLAAGLAHEVGNPLSALMGMQDLLLDGGLTEEERADFLRRMRKETARIHRVLSDLLAFARPSRPDALGRGIETPGSLAEASDDLLALLGPQKDFKDIALATDFSPDLARVPLCHEELTQILLNLVINARDAIADASPIDSGTIETRGHVWVTARPKAGSPSTVELTVADDGPGIAPAIAATLFEPFVSTKEVGRGTGLGLAVTRGLVEGAGGTIRVVSNQPRGARFVIELPMVGVGAK